MPENKQNPSTGSYELKIGKVLKGLMQTHNLTYREFACAVEIPRSTIFNCVQGCLPRSAGHLKKICEKFNISAHELLFDEPVTEISQSLRDGQVIRGTFLVQEN